MDEILITGDFSFEMSGRGKDKKLKVIGADKISIGPTEIKIKIDKDIPKQDWDYHEPINWLCDDIL